MYSGRSPQSGQVGSVVPPCQSQRKQVLRVVKGHEVMSYVPCTTFTYSRVRCSQSPIDLWVRL